MPAEQASNTNQAELSLIMHTLGRMEGSNNAQFQALSENLSLIRADIKRVEESSHQQIKDLEQNIKNQITFVERRVSNLENQKVEKEQHLKTEQRVSNLEKEDRKQAIAIAKGSVTGGGLVALFVQGVIELIKRV